MLLNKKKNFKNKKKIKQNGGTNIINASIDLIRSMKDLGDSIFNEISSITNIQNDINNAASPSQGTPNVMNGPSKFSQPNLQKIPNR
jgi:hypothetical protein